MYRAIIFDMQTWLPVEQEGGFETARDAWTWIEDRIDLDTQFSSVETDRSMAVDIFSH